MSEKIIDSNVLVTSTDTAKITKVRHQEVLLKAGVLQSAIFNSANFSCIATDENGVIQIFNVGAERMLGYTAVEVLNKVTPADISDPRELVARAKMLSLEFDTPIKPGFEALIFKASRGIEDIYELTKIRKDGSRFPAVVSVSALRDAQNAIIGYLLIGTDNTARNQAEEALIKAGALQNAIFNSANFSSIATDTRGLIQIFNVGAERMLGYAAPEVLNKISLVDITDRQALIARSMAMSLELDTTVTPGFEALICKAMRDREDFFELTYILRAGIRLPVMVSVMSLCDPQDRVIGYLFICTDNTKPTRTEKELAKIVNEFIFVASHDLQEPLRTLTNYVTLLQEDILHCLTPEQLVSIDITEDVRFIVEAAKRMNDLIQSMLETMRAGSQPLQVKEVDLNQCLATVLANLDVVKTEKQADIRCAGLPVILADVDQMNRVLQNLISNAMKFCQRQPIITLSASEDAHEWTITVTDNGIGISAENLKKIFAPFQRLNHRKTYPGMGIGLVIAKKAVERHGGRLSVTSQVGVGSVFKFTLPKNRSIKS